MKLFRYSCGIVQRIFEKYKRIKSSSETVLMFHQVNNDLIKWNDPFCSITEKSFCQLLEKIQDCTFGTTTDLVKKQQLENEKTIIYITFDDAYDDVYYNCYPILREKEIPYTIFIATSLLDKPGYLSTYMIREMIKNSFCTIGAHTVTHSPLRYLGEDEVKYELSVSKKFLQEKFGVIVDEFAYPYGSIYACSLNNVYSAMEMYSIAFSTIDSNLPANIIGKYWFLPRRNVNEENWEKIVRNLICH